MSEARDIGEEAARGRQAWLAASLIERYLSGPHIIDIGDEASTEEPVPVVPQAIVLGPDDPGHGGTTLPFADGSQNAVFVRLSLDHGAGFTRALRDWFRVLATGGFLVIVVPHRFRHQERDSNGVVHGRVHTPSSLMAEIGGALRADSFRLRHLADHDRGFHDAVDPAENNYEIEMVIERIAPAALEESRSDLERSAEPPDTEAFARDAAIEAARDLDGGTARAIRLPAAPLDLVLYEFGRAKPMQRRILALQLGHFGDFIIGLPALRQLREAFPDDHITLVVGSWNRGVAEGCGLVDLVATHDHFPQVARRWNGKPVEDTAAFARATPGHFDVAVDLRVDEDTRHLLQHADAVLRCGLGTTSRFPYLDVALPLPRTVHRTAGTDTRLSIVLDPDRFRSRMPVRNALRHRTKLRVSNTHLIFGPYVPLPAGRFRAIFGLQFAGLRWGPFQVRLRLDVVQGGSKILAERVFTATEIGGAQTDSIVLDFDNDDDGAPHEFRVYARGWPVNATLTFSGVRVDQLDAPSPRPRQSGLHIGEQQSLLVQLVADRTRALYAEALDGPAFAPLSDVVIPQGRHRVVMAPLSNSDLRDWPAAHYAALARMLVERLGCVVLLTGSPSQSAALDAIAKASGAADRVINLGGRTAWSDAPKLLQSADLVICNNSGIAHLAASLGVRTLALYSASHLPQEWGPRGDRSRALMAIVPCSPCGFDRLSDCPHDHACMQGLTPDSVFAQAAEWLGGDGIAAQ